jgi:hypothetical protein
MENVDVCNHYPESRVAGLDAIVDVVAMKRRERLAVKKHPLKCGGRESHEQAVDRIDIGVTGAAVNDATCLVYETCLARPLPPGEARESTRAHYPDHPDLINQRPQQLRPEVVVDDLNVVVQ